MRTVNRIKGINLSADEMKTLIGGQANGSSNNGGSSEQAEACGSCPTEGHTCAKYSTGCKCAPASGIGWQDCTV